MYAEWNDRCISEREYAETLDLMAEFGLTQDMDSAVKQHQIEVLEAGLSVVETTEDLEEVPF